MSLPEPVVYTRDRWTRVTPSETIPLRVPVSHVFYTSTQSDMCFTLISCSKEMDYVIRRELKRVNYENDSNSKRRDLYYNFLIGGDGAIYDSRGWDVSPIMPSEYRKFAKKSILIAFIGRFSKYPPSRKMFWARDALLSYGMQNGYIVESYREEDI